MESQVDRQRIGNYRRLSAQTMVHYPPSKQVPRVVGIHHRHDCRVQLLLDTFDSVLLMGY